MAGRTSSALRAGTRSTSATAIDGDGSGEWGEGWRLS